MEPLEAEALDETEPPRQDGKKPWSGARKRDYLTLIGTAFIVGLLLVGGWMAGLFDVEENERRTPEMGLSWREPVLLPRALDNPLSLQDIPEGAIGYEPSLAVDSQGNLFYTAHKDLAWQTSWDYLASWFFVSRDGGETWGAPADWGIGDQGSLWAGDEGDIGIDANDRVYFDDTTLIDNWLHVWDNGGDDYVRSQPLGSSGLDDRPWITAQGDGIVHYLGNWALDTPGCDGQAGRYWYYRSDDGGLTFSQCEAFPGGWTQFEAERDGDYIYIDSGGGGHQ